MAEHKVGQQQPVEMILLRQLASYLDTPIFVVDVAGRLVYYNEPAEPLLGVRFDEVGVMEPEAWRAAFRPGDEKGRVFDQGEDPLGKALRERRPMQSRLWISGLDGVRRPIGSTTMPLIGQGGDLLGALAIFWPEPDR